MRPASAAAWIAWTLGGLGFLYAWFHRVTPSVMVDRLMADFEVGGAVLGALSSLYFYAYAGVQVPVGVIIDRWGARLPFAGSLVVATLGAGLFASAEGIGQAYFGRVLIGVGAGFGWVSMLKIASVHFPAERFALLSGAGMFIGLLGGLGGQVVAGAMVDGIGWRATMWTTAAAGGLLAVAVLLLVRDSGRSDGTDHRQTMRSVLSALGTALRRPQVWLITTGGAIGAAPIFILAALWGVPYLMQVHGLPRTGAASLTATMLFGWGSGAFVAGWIADRLGNRRGPLLAGLALALAMMATVLYGPDLPVPVLAGVLLVGGLGSGTVVLTYAMAGDLAPAEARGSAYGFANMMIIAAGAVFQPLTGWLLDRGWTGGLAGGARVYTPETFTDAFIVIPICYIAGITMIALSRERPGQG